MTDSGGPKKSISPTPILSEQLLRKRFVLTLSMAAAVYGAVWSYRLLGWQADSFTDILKFSSLIFFAALVLSYVWWRLIRSKWSGAKSGALAGFLTAITLIPVPTLIGSLKTQLVAGAELMPAAALAVQYSISTYSLAEFIAIPLSMIVGIWAAQS